MLLFIVIRSLLLKVVLFLTDKLFIPTPWFSVTAIVDLIFQEKIILNPKNKCASKATESVTDYHFLSPRTMHSQCRLKAGEASGVSAWHLFSFVFSILTPSAPHEWPVKLKENWELVTQHIMSNFVQLVLFQFENRSK